jgi:HD-GYP domain-containing protein (c-di-GMP phosphodiesterase class II)
MAWLPLDPALLRIGLYVKLDHSWIEHPFIRNTFAISSPSEIAIIRKHRLTKIYYDPDRTNADAQAALVKPASGESAELDSEMVQSVEEDEKALQKSKDAHIQTVHDLQEARDEAGRNYSETTKRASEMFAMMNAGYAEGVQLATEIVTSMVQQLAQPSLALLLVQTEDLHVPGLELAAQAVNVSALSLLTGTSLNLSQGELLHLGLGALFHNVGMHKLPSSLLAKKQSLSPTESKQLRQYPKLGKEILEAVPGVPPEVVRIVYQHREYLDGSGFPNGSVNGDIGQLARVVGIVTEYNQLTSARHSTKGLSLAQALSHLYVNMKPKLGLDLIEPFIVAMTVYPPGSFVEMSDRSIGVVVKINAHERMRPIVMLYDPSTSRKETFVIDLSLDRSLTIRKLLDPKSVPREVVEVLSPGQAVCHTYAGG